MSEITFEISKDVTRVWDLDVPVVVDKEKNNIKGYLTGPIDEPFNYNELCYLLNNADGDTTVDLYINTPGGIIDSAFMLASAIKASKAIVTAHLSGTVASAGTIITMACDKIELTPHLSFMIHNYSGGMSGKGHEMKARQAFTDEHLNRAFKSFYSGFLTEEEMDSVIGGTDLWMGSEQVQTRWNSHIKYIEGEV